MFNISVDLSHNDFTFSSETLNLPLEGQLLVRWHTRAATEDFSSGNIKTVRQQLLLPIGDLNILKRSCDFLMAEHVQSSAAQR